ncbi:MAG TPA: acetate/propionate family kinase [Acidimicrobiales bacterium]|nr:acetate/propionate family kinase [Acidimicrobiales bacterium]
MRVLVVNAGSSTLKLRLLGDDDRTEAAHDVDPWAGDADASVLEPFSAALEQADAVGHRVVHGGPSYRRATRLDGGVLAEIEALTPLAPLHQPRSLAAIAAVTTALPDRPAVACFDTAFHASLPAAAATYALPRDWIDRWSLRRYGFHGLSHAYAARRGPKLAGWDGAAGAPRTVTCHLGAGASLCAVRDGRSVDTTMGFTPLEGLVMATRSGTVDPGLVLWLLTEAGLEAGEVTDALERGSGLAGLSGTSGDMRELQERASEGDGGARQALDVYLHRLRREIGAMVAALGGLDLLVFTGGIGEHAPAVRADAAEGLGYLGVAVDADLNATTTADGDISRSGSTVRAVVVTSREDLEVARQVRAVLST